MGYRIYDPLIKRMIIESGNRNLFPDLNIPRTTINYWLKSSKEGLSSLKNYGYEFCIKKLKEEVFELKAKNMLVTQCLKRLTKELGAYDKNTKENRKFVIEIIDSFREFLPLREIILTVGISQTTYYRWRVELNGCTFHNLKKCKPSVANQLTHEEQEKLVKYATDVNFRKFSTVSLMHYCKRKNLLQASLHSWRKYLILYGVDRKFFTRRVKRYKKGIRAQKSNELWHIDITIIKFSEGRKAYLQVVMDNYSRMIIAWSLSLDKTMTVTCKTIIKSFNLVPHFKGDIMCDAGTENLGSMPRKLLVGKGIKQLVAKRDIMFSNSMVESIFRQFKQKFYLKESKNFSSLYQLIYKFVRQYNEVIPHSSLHGATPIELFNNSFDLERYKNTTKLKLVGIREERRKEYYDCLKCTKKYLRQEKCYS